MAEKQVRIVLDTNWYISGTIHRKSRRTLYQLLSNTSLQIFYSQELLDEYSMVIKRYKFKKLVSQQQVSRFVRVVLPMLNFIKVKSVVKKSRDVKDNFVLALAKDSKANYLVTGDPDLLVLKKLRKTSIVTMSEFLQLQ